MAFLMLLHEKMRLQRKVSRLTLKQAQASSRKERVTKQIERIQKMYSKKESQISNMVKQGNSMFQLALMQQFGIGSQGLNPMSFLGGASMCAQQGYAALAQELNCGLNVIQAVLAGQLQKGKDGYANKDGSISIDENQYQMIQAGIAQVHQMEGYQSYQAQMLQSQYQANVSIWEEAMKAELEAEQDEALAPLQEQEEEWDLESQSAEVQLQDARARLDAIKEALKDGIKDSAPTFGLG
ncbi:hypothetical protein IKQ21_04290 [bacterium]|nr:hypothetical protein [bacterium]